MDKEKIIIRDSSDEDVRSIMELLEKAFGGNVEALLVEELLTDQTAEPRVSLVAQCNDEIVGYILFTRIYFAGEQQQPLMHILAPVAVLPNVQQQGIGSLLIKTGMDRLRTMGCQRMFVLGHKEYYPKFGFVPDAEKQGFLAPYPMDDEYKEYWMVHSVVGEETAEKCAAAGSDTCSCSEVKKMECCAVLNRREFWG